MRNAFIRAIDALSTAMDRAGAVVHRHRRPIRDGLIIVGLLRFGYYLVVQRQLPWEAVWVGARAYWGIDLARPYAHGLPGDTSAFLYSPAFAQAMAPVSLLPFPVFAALWSALLVGILVWLVRPWPWALLMFVLPVTWEMAVANVHLLLAAAVVLGFRFPVVWALPAFTKISPSIGIAWPFFRGEWRAFLTAAAALAGILLASFAINPTAWVEWAAFLMRSPEGSELIIPRLAAGVALVAFGAFTGRPWLVAVATWIALPVVYINSWVILLAVIRLRERVAPVLPIRMPSTPATARTGQQRDVTALFAADA